VLWEPDLSLFQVVVRPFPIIVMRLVDLFVVTEERRQTCSRTEDGTA
jgi:hypothetical protein